MSDQREMTLDEYLESKLPDCHLARRQLRMLRAERDALAKRLNDEDLSHSNTMEQRDFAETMADNLSAAIMGITGRDIGEHSSANCPWSNAFEHAEEYESERDVLDAHVERLRETLQWIWDKVNLGGWAHERVKTALADTPDASLARLIAEKQADVLESCENIAETSFMPYLGREEQVVLMNDILKVSAELRRQAEGEEG